MERKIEIRRRDSKSTDPEQLVSYLSNVYGLTSVKYFPSSATNSGTLFITTEDNYDLQDLGNKISNSGYSVILPGFSEPRQRKSILETIVSKVARVAENVGNGINREIKKYNDRKHIDNLAKKSNEQGVKK